MKPISIQYEGRSWRYDERAVTVQTATIIKRAKGFSFPDGLYRAFREVDPDAIQTLAWIIRGQNGVVEQIDDVNWSVLDFIDAFAEGAKGAAEDAAKDAAKDADPNPRSGNVETSTSPNSETATS